MFYTPFAKSNIPVDALLDALLEAQRFHNLVEARVGTHASLKRHAVDNRNRGFDNLAANWSDRNV